MKNNATKQVLKPEKKNKIENIQSYKISFNADRISKLILKWGIFIFLQY